MTITEAIIIALISAGASIIVSIAATTMQGWKWKNGEKNKMDADAASVITMTTREMVLQLRQEMADRDKDHAAEIAAMQQKMDIVIAENQSLREENEMLREKMERFEDVQDWAERLVLQVKSLRGDPVKIKTGPLGKAGRA